MARMHARRRGISRSVRPYRTQAPEWSNTNKEAIIKQIVDLRRQGSSTAEIGLVMRDKYGVPSVKLATGKKITQILRDNDLASEIPEAVSYTHLTLPTLYSV